MRKALLCCGPLPALDERYDEIWSVGALATHRLASQGVSSRNLFDIALPDLDQRLRLRVEAGLQAEAMRAGVCAWADIAFQHVHWRFVRYYQYRLRLEHLIQASAIGHLTLGSSGDTDLRHACMAACNSTGVELALWDGPGDAPSSLLSFLAAYDLPSRVTWFESLAAPCLALLYRLKKTRVFYQPYNNLAQGHPDSAVLTWRRSVCFPGRHLPDQRLGQTRPLLNLNTQIRETQGLFHDDAWPDFDAHDVKVLASAFSYFAERYDSHQLDRLYAVCRAFLKRAGVRRLVLNSDNTGTTRLLSKAAKAQGLRVDYLPHGLIMEDLSLQTRTACGVDRVLAWNAASAQAYEQRGTPAAVIVHPANMGAIAPKRPLPDDLSRLRVLILPPEWVGLSFSSRPDCFEQDLLDVFRALEQLGIRTAFVKCHNSVKEVLDAKHVMLQAIQSCTAVQISVIDGNTRTQELFDQFDLAIVGPTTGLLEASRSGTPFVGFRALMPKAGLLQGYDLPHADTPAELVSAIQAYDVDTVNHLCQRLGASLRAGQHPFSMGLDAE